MSVGQNKGTATDSFRNRKSLAEREIKGINTKIEEFDFEASIHDWTFLTDELIESRLSNHSGSIRGGIDSCIFPRGRTVQHHSKTNWCAVLRWSQYEVQVATVESEENPAGRNLEHSALGIDVPGSA